MGEDEPVELRTLARRSLAYRRGEDPQGLRALAAAASAPPPADPQASARWTLALEPWSTTRGDERSALFALLAAAEVLEAEDEGASLRAWAAAGRIRLRRGDFSALAAEAPRIEAVLARVDDAEAHVQARIVLAHASAWVGEAQRGAAYLADAALIAREESLELALGLIRAQQGHASTHAGDLQGALASTELAVKAATDRGLRRLFGLAHWSRGWTLAAGRRWAEAATSLELAARTQQALGEWAPAASSWARLVQIESIRGGDLRRAIRPAVRAARRAEGAAAAIEVHAACAEVWRSAGAPDRAEVHVQALVEAAATDSEGRAAAALARLRAGRGRFFMEELGHSASPTRVGLRTDGAGFTLPGGEQVDLKRRRGVQAVLRRLALEAEVRPGSTVTAEELMAVGWPTGRSRDLHTAIWTLRRLGLGDVLQTVGTGYRLDPDGFRWV